MINLLLLSGLICLCLVFVIPSHANTIYIHTDNQADLIALKSKSMTNNLSVATNLHALNSQSANIQFEYMTTKRSLLLMNNRENICIVNRVKTKKRIEKYLFSQPINIFLSRRLYQNTSYPSLTMGESIDNSIHLSKLFIARPRAKVIISAQISYGDVLDAQIAALPIVNKVIRHSGEQDTGIIAMFANGRAEFALLYPHQVYGSSFTISGRSYSIASVPPYILGHLMCAKNDVTKGFINSVNNYLSSSGNMDKLLGIHLNYINPIDQTVIESFFRQVFY